MSEELWALVSALGILLVRAGMVVHETGMLRAKNSASGLIRNLADLCIATLVFWAVGASIFFAGNRGAGLLGINVSYLLGSPGGSNGAVFLALAATLLATGILGGVLSERSRFFPVCIASAVLAAVIVPISAFWTRSGWLSHLGFHDFAGASFLHLAGALCAGVGAVYVGPRMGKYNRDGSTNGIPGHNVPLACVGELLMLAGWIPYVAGFLLLSPTSGRAGLIAMNVILSAAAAGLTGILFSQWRYGKPDVHLAFGGVLGGLVAICAGADRVPNWSAVVIGAASGFLVPLAMLAIELFWRIDDPTSSLSTRGVAAAWGILAVGVFGHTSTWAGRFKLLGAQVLGLVAVAALVGGLSIGLFVLLQRTTGLRSREADEYDGLDLAEHDIGAYPDFQQTTIKSYHLREA